ncbi:MAG: hypothetical protein JW829_05260 [Pirellulales bacterium]|nr:hypothetical protein [Pirellulales bacterium]
MDLKGDDLETIRSRIIEPLLAVQDENSINDLIHSMQSDGTWPDIDYRDKSRSAWMVMTHLRRVETLARAFYAPHSAFHGNRDILSAALKGLDAWLRMDPKNPNWWWNQIGVPKALLPILLLLDNELSETERAGGLEILRRAKIGMTGQNLIWVTEITAGRGLFERNAVLAAKAYRRIADEIRMDLGEGIQPDFSFHQHGPCLYSHGYGAAFVVDCSRIATQVDGTAMAFPPAKIELLAQLILDGTQWMARGAATDFGAEGREISRKGQSASHLAAAAASMLQLKTGREEEFHALAERVAGRPDARPSIGNRHFWRADMMTHHRQAYYASARMHSTRLANTDSPANEEGLLSHHLADGCFVLMQTGREYQDIFGVWDWEKIPGTTVRLQGVLSGSPRRMGTTSFVGGVSNGSIGLAACDFERDGLTAKKAWFFFDKEIVCLGTDITSARSGDVVTTLNQCCLNGDVILAESGRPKILDRGNHTYSGTGWLWHDSVAYLFLEPADLRLQNMSKSGSWHASNHRYAQQNETRDLFTAWIAHGTHPQAENYSYLVVPDIDHEDVAEYLVNVPIRLLANNERLQAVGQNQLRLVAVAFYSPGTIAIRPGVTIATDTACLMLVQETGDLLQLTVANPENKAAEVRITLSEGQVDREAIIQLPEGFAAGRSVTQTIPLHKESISRACP